MATEIRAQDVVVLIIYLVLLILGAYFLTRYVSRRAMKKGVKKPEGKAAGGKSKWKQGKHVSVLDRIPIDRDKTILVVEFAEKRYLMATTGQDIKLLDKLKTEEAREAQEAEEAEDTEPPSFETEETQKNSGFFERFSRSFKVAFKNYCKGNTVPFGIRLQNEMQKGKEGVRQDRK
jgi:flagellar biogenesis protein FliO